MDRHSRPWGWILGLTLALIPRALPAQAETLQVRVFVIKAAGKGEVLSHLDQELEPLRGRLIKLPWSEFRLAATAVKRCEITKATLFELGFGHELRVTPKVVKKEADGTRYTCDYELIHITTKSAPPGEQGERTSEVELKATVNARDGGSFIIVEPRRADKKPSAGAPHFLFVITIQAKAYGS